MCALYVYTGCYRVMSRMCREGFVRVDVINIRIDVRVFVFGNDCGLSLEMFLSR